MLQLSKREKLLIKVLAALVGVVAVYYLIISQLVSVSGRYSSRHEENLAKIEKLNKIYSEYNVVRQKRIRYESQINSDQGITTLIEEHAKTLGIIGNKSYVRVIPGSIKDNYKKVSAEVKFVGVDISSVIKFIYKMENSNSLIKTSYLRISEALKGRDIYDAEIKFDSVTSQ